MPGEGSLHSEVSCWWKQSLYIEVTCQGEVGVGGLGQSWGCLVPVL